MTPSQFRSLPHDDQVEMMAHDAAQVFMQAYDNHLEAKRIERMAKSGKKGNAWKR